MVLLKTETDRQTENSAMDAVELFCQLLVRDNGQSKRLVHETCERHIRHRNPSGEKSCCFGHMVSNIVKSGDTCITQKTTNHLSDSSLTHHMDSSVLHILGHLSMVLSK